MEKRPFGGGLEPIFSQQPVRGLPGTPHDPPGSVQRSVEKPVTDETPVVDALDREEFFTRYNELSIGAVTAQTEKNDPAVDTTVDQLHELYRLNPNHYQELLALAAPEEERST